MTRNAFTMASQPTAVETPSQNPVGSPPVPPNLIITALPADPLKMIFRALPASHSFVAPVCRRFRDLYGDAKKEKKEKHTTYIYSIASEAALQTYLEDQYIVFHNSQNRETSMIGARCGRTDWVERGGVFNESTCRAAALGGQLRILKWLRDRYCSWDLQTCEGAASNGHLEVLKWARGEGCEWNSITCEEAACNGHLEVLQWARVEGCEWNRFTCYWASKNGHLEVLKWAISERCPYDEHDFEKHITDPNFHEWFGEYKANNLNRSD